MVMEGYKLFFENLLVTVWSAPNYCYRCGNIASVMEVDEYLKPAYKVIILDNCSYLKRLIFPICKCQKCQVQIISYRDTSIK